MARYSGKIGFGIPTETPADSGIWVDDIQERRYKGDVVRNTRRLEDGEGLNSDISINNSISIVADTFAIDNFWAMKYIYVSGARWVITSVEVQRPRLILSLGEVYNGPTE